MDLEALTKIELIKLCKMYAKNWLAHDGCWFLSVEKKYGMDEAIEFDKETWKKFTVIEAKRIMEEFSIAPSGGLSALEKALGFRLYATVNRQSIEKQGNRLIFKMDECRVQSARRKKNLPDFSCKDVGIIEYSLFASTIDPRIKTRCITCPPEKHDGNFYCAWEFSTSEI